MEFDLEACVALNPAMEPLLRHCPELGRAVILNEVSATVRIKYAFEEDAFDLNPHLAVADCADEVVKEAADRGVRTSREEVFLMWITDLYRETRTKLANRAPPDDKGSGEAGKDG